MKDAIDLAGVFGLKALSGILNRLPLPAALSAGRFFGGLASFFLRRRREAYADLKAALGPALSEKKRRKVLRAMGRHFGMMFVETLRISSFDPEAMKKRVTYVAYDAVDRIFGSPRGLVFLTAHFGNWELLQVVSGNHGRKIHVLAQPQKHPRMDAYLQKLREARGGTQAVSEGMGVRGLLKVLKQNGAIGLLGDRTAGRDEGILLSFFGRKTTVPTGAFELARRTGALLIPVFFVRKEGTNFELHFEKPIDCSDSSETGVQAAARQYLDLLEGYIRRHPEQWLWFGKRWKYAWTKRLLVLSDGKPGHTKQSEAVVKHFQNVSTQYGRPGMEYPAETVEVRYKTRFHQAFFYAWALILLPWIQGRLGWLRGFLTSESWEKVSRAGADFVISAGAGLVPLNRCLARDLGAKSIVLMNPPFPWNLFRYDLALVPAHDRGWIAREALRPLLAPNPVDLQRLKDDGRKLAASLRAPERVALALFLGGNTRNYQMSLTELEYLFAELERASASAGDYVVTTSRRTPDTVTDYFRGRLLRDPACQLFVNAKEDPRPEVAGGMMALAQILIVTEDSISMISEALAAGKPVIVVTFQGPGLPEKHKRFQRLLAGRGAVRLARPEALGRVIAEVRGQSGSAVAASESEKIEKRLQEIL